MIPGACSMRLQLPGDSAHQAGPFLRYQLFARFKVKLYIRSHLPLLPQQRQGVNKFHFKQFFFKSPYFLTWSLCETLAVLAKQSTTASILE